MNPDKPHLHHDHHPDHKRERDQGHIHDHASSHGHSHSHGHHHGQASGNRLMVALVLVLVFMALEAAAGFLFNSLALISDSLHMLGDAISLCLGAVAAFLAKRRASMRRTYGYKRVEVLAAFTNALSLLWVCAWLGYAAISRLRDPLEVHGQGVLIVALIGLAVNVVMLFWLHHGEGERSLNEQGVIWHVIGDTLSSLAAVAAGIVITLTGKTWIDPLLALLVIGILVYGSVRLLLRTAHVLVEGAPEGVDAEKVRHDLLEQAQVTAVHDLHVWTLDGRDHFVSAHIATGTGLLKEGDIARRLTRMLKEKHHFDHITLQVGLCQDDDCGARCDEPAH